MLVHLISGHGKQTIPPEATNQTMLYNSHLKQRDSALRHVTLRREEKLVTDVFQRPHRLFRLWYRSPDVSAVGRRLRQVHGRSCQRVLLPDKILSGLAYVRCVPPHQAFAEAAVACIERQEPGKAQVSVVDPISASQPRNTC